MSLTNRDLFYRDPTAAKIPNDGVAKVMQPEDDQQWDVLRWELESFVCDGEYERGLETILSTFLANLPQPQQPPCGSAGSTAAASHTSSAFSSSSGATSCSPVATAPATLSPCRPTWPPT